MHATLVPAGDGWFEWRQEPPLPVSLSVRIAARRGGRLVLTGLLIDGEPSADVLRSVRIGRIAAAANAQLSVVDGEIVLAGAPPRPRRAPAKSKPVLDSVAPSTRRPDTFYRDVAREYHDLVHRSSRPAVELAEANGVPVTTAHRWIKEARRRGFLPPGHPGKAG